MEVGLITRLEWAFAGSAGVSPARMKNSCGVDSKSVAGETPALPVSSLYVGSIAGDLNAERATRLSNDWQW
jgi:hypothetical protein